MSWSGDEENLSNEEYEYKSVTQNRNNKPKNSMKLRDRNKLKSNHYSQHIDQWEKDKTDKITSKRSKSRLRNLKNEVPGFMQQNDLDRALDEMDRERKEQLLAQGYSEEYNGNENETGIFNPSIDIVLWRRHKKKGSEESGKESKKLKMEYLIKFKDYSFLHCKWRTENEILSMGKLGKNKLNRFNRMFDKKIIEDKIDIDAPNTQYFESSVLKVDKILYSTEIFTVIHPKKSNELKGKWSEYLSIVVSKLLNFAKDGINYGIYFMEPVDPDREGCQNYFKEIMKPMDLGTLNNKVYLDNYSCFQEFWKDLGLIFKNCRKFNPNPKSDIRILCDTLRELARHLYILWFKKQKERYQNLIKEIERKKELFTQKFKDNQKSSIEDNINREINVFLQNLYLIVNKGIAALKRGDNNLVLKCKELYLHEITYNSSVFGQNSRLIATVIQQLEKMFSLNDNFHQAEEIFKKVQESLNYTVQNSKKKYISHITNIYLNNNPQLLNSREIELFNPGHISYHWLNDFDAEISVEKEELEYFKETGFGHITFEMSSDKLYLVKWRNMSYLEATWEFESDLNNQTKINEFKIFNRAIVKELRINYTNQLKRHRKLVEIKFNARKRSKISLSLLQDHYNKLFYYNFKNTKQLFQYTVQTQPIFKNQKLLRSYQLDSLNWLIESWYIGRNVILADEMGLGKTIQTIALLNYLTSHVHMRGPFLVVAPLSTLEHWKRTIEDWSTMNCVLYYDVNGLNGRKACRAYEWFYTDISLKGSVLHAAEICKFNVLITSFEVFLQDVNNVLINLPFQYLIIDEAHRLKNRNSKLFHSLKKLPCKRILLLTGTPIQNNTLELWSLLNFIEPEKFYCSERFQELFGDLSSASQVEMLHKILKPYLLRRMKEEVETSIPPLQETIIDIEMTNIQKKIYRSLYEKNKGILVQGSGITITSSLNNLEMQLRKCCNHPFLMVEIMTELTKDLLTEESWIECFINSSGKMILIDKLLMKMKKEKKKVLIFSQFTKMLRLLESYLRYKEFKYEKIDGGIKAKERQNSIDRFNGPNSDRDIFLLSTKAGGLGINLTSANIVIIYDSDWNPQNDVQATARAHRIGQLSEVKVYRLVTKNTYEAEMFERACKKLALDQAIFMGGAFHSTKRNVEGMNDKKKIKKEEIELLLKKGIIGLINNDSGNQQINQSIEEILRNSRVAKFSVSNGSCTYKKSSFAAKQTDSTLKLDDPNFWSVVLKNTESKSKKLLKEFKNLESEQKFKDIEIQKTFMISLSNVAFKLIESKIKIEGHNQENEMNLHEILTKINSNKNFHHEYKNIALLLSDEIIKPTRRYKNIDINKINININVRRTNTIKKYEDEAEDGLFGEFGSEKENSEEFFSDDDPSDLNCFQNKGKNEKFKTDFCCLCVRKKCTFRCSGPCRRSFHSSCKELIENEISVLDDTYYKAPLEENSKTDLELRKIYDTSYLCGNCEENEILCYKCNSLGVFDVDEIIWKTKAIVKPSIDLESMIQCKKCLKMYHNKCLHKSKKKMKKGRLYKCQSHFCHKCNLISDKLYTCIKCPVSFHIQCMKKSKVKVISGRNILCHNHNWTKGKVRKINSSRVGKNGKENKGFEDRRDQGDSLLKVRLMKNPMHLLTYEQLDIEDPITVDYSMYRKNWCKYCGARFTSKFYIGPWGEGSFCKIHYDLWRKKKLRIGKITDKNPTAPIDMDENTELKYLSKSDQVEGDNADDFQKRMRIKKLATLRPNSKKFKF